MAAKQPSALRALMTGPYVAYYGNLARALGRSPSAAIFLGCVARWEQYSEDGWVFRTQEQIEEETALTAKMQSGARKVLADYRVMEEERRGAPPRLFYRIDWGNVEAALQGFPEASLNLPEGNFKPDQREDSNIQARDTSKSDNDPPGGEAPQADASPEDDEEDKSTAGDYVAFVYEELEGVTPPILRNRRGRLGKDFDEYIKAGTDEEVLWKAARWIVARWRGQYGKHSKLSVEMAVEDVVNNKAFSGPAGGLKTANQNTASEASVTPITPGSGMATHEAGIAALEANQELKRYAAYAYKYDFASTEGEERPPWPVYANLGGDEDERETNLNRIRTVVKRAVRDAQDNGELKSAMHYIVSYGLEAGDVQVIYHQAKADGWSHEQMDAELERRTKRRG